MSAGLAAAFTVAENGEKTSLPTTTAAVLEPTDQNPLPDLSTATVDNSNGITGADWDSTGNVVNQSTSVSTQSAETSTAAKNKDFEDATEGGKIDATHTGSPLISNQSIAMSGIVPSVANKNGNVSTHSSIKDEGSVSLIFQLFKRF